MHLNFKFYKNLAWLTGSIVVLSRVPRVNAAEFFIVYPVFPIIFFQIIKKTKNFRDLLTILSATFFSCFFLETTIRRIFAATEADISKILSLSLILATGVIFTFMIYAFFPEKKGEVSFFKIRNILKYRAIWNYKKTLKIIVENTPDFTEDSNTILNNLIKEYGIENIDLSLIHKNAFKNKIESVLVKKRISPKETKALDEFLRFTKLKILDFGENEEDYIKYQTLWNIENGILPKVDKDELKIAFEPSEELHYYTEAEAYPETHWETEITKVLPKKRGIVDRILNTQQNFDVEQSTNEITDYEDFGTFWITDARVGFTGKKRGFIICYKDLFSFELSFEGLSLHRKGKDDPFVVVIDDYEIPEALLKHYFKKHRE